MTSTIDKTLNGLLKPIPKPEFIFIIDGGDYDGSWYRETDVFELFNQGTLPRDFAGKIIQIIDGKLVDVTDEFHNSVYAHENDSGDCNVDEYAGHGTHCPVNGRA